MAKKVLVIDDDPTICQLIYRVLDRNNYEVYCIHNGAEGLKKLAQIKPDLIILDIIMPVMDGFAFYRKLKENKKTAKIPVLILTGKVEMKNSFLAIGADSFLAKPFSSGALIENVNTLVEKGFIDKIWFPREEFDRLVSLAKSGRKRRILTAAVPTLLDKVLGELVARKGYELIVAQNARDLVEKAILCLPDVILLNVQVQTVSAYEIIRHLYKKSEPKSNVLLFSYFQSIDTAQNSVDHVLYSQYLEQDFKNTKNPPHYLGAFSKGTYQGSFAKAVEQYLK